MKSVSLLFASGACALFFGMLSGCTGTKHTEYDTGRRAIPGAGRTGMGSIMGDAQAMCELYRRMTSANTHKERQEMMDKYMAGMSPEARRRSMHMMRERCR